MSKILDINNPYPPDFRYSELNWPEVWSTIKNRTNFDELAMRKKLETCAMRYQLANEQDFSRSDTVISEARKDAKEIANVCLRLEDLLEKWNKKWFPDDARFDNRSDDERRETAIFWEKLAKIRTQMESTCAQGISYRRNRRQDQFRDVYLLQLCEIWVENPGGTLTASFDRKTGEASGACVEYLYKTAKPVLGQFTRNGARRFIQRIRNEQGAAAGALFDLWTRRV